MQQPMWADDADTELPSPARVYDYFLGGSHNFAVDRAMAARLAEAMPDIGQIMRANRDFLRRAVGHLTDAGVRQFLDLGSGIPTAGNVHEIVQRAAPDGRVTYVDIDPVAVAHSRAVLTGNPGAGIVQADLREPDAVLAAAQASGLLDLDEPVAVLLVGVLHQVSTSDLGRIIASYRDASAPGSYLVLSHASADHRPREARSLQATYNRGYGPAADMTLRTEAEIMALFTGFELLPPGLVQLPQWRPEEPDGAGSDPRRFSTYAGVGRRNGQSGTPDA